MKKHLRSTRRSQWYLVLFGLGIILCALLFWTFRSLTQTSRLAPSQEPLSSPSVQVVDEKKLQGFKRQDIDYSARAELERAERVLDLKRVAIPIVNGEAVIDIILKLKGTCFPGDANAIEMDLSAAPDHKLLATLESLSEKGLSYSWDVPKDLFEMGQQTKQFRVPVQEEPQQYGFFLCTALLFEKSCRSKRTRDVNEIFTEHIRKDPNAGKELRNIFFQYFLLDKKGLAAFSTNPKYPEQFESLKKYNRDRRAKGEPDKEIDFAKTHLKTLDSLPFVFDNKKIVVELPQYRTTACMEKAHEKN